MKSHINIFVLLVVLGAVIISACGSPAATEAPYMEDFAAAPEMPMQEAPASVEQPASSESEAGKIQEGSVYETGTDGNVALTTHLIIKSADMRVLVENSDVAIDRVTQIVGDTGGYIISSRVWNQPHLDGKNYKYATITIGVPVQQFERVLNRLRGLAVQVLDENASGEDVTDQYVDLQSQLTNLEATRERIKSFLDDATNVDEALRINQQLSEIERQIEEIKGRINYLQDRSAFSTITVNIEPQLPEVVIPTPTPMPTPEPEPWKPGETFDNAKKSVTRAYQNIIDILIWFFVVLVPIFAPPVLIVWLIWKFITRKPNKPS
ncbi:MAG: DUF4349 domain-containing protein [Anaerolineales bacterium]|nr:DUF4349 domain-containing protein [Anaerolineales bacterium]MBX3036058.1 DUF4349 domain-containing protein [Anaerolineales bacterium]